jgi:hypothetical protein
MPYFIYKDYFNEIEDNGKQWEVIHPRIFIRLLNPMNWKQFPAGTHLEYFYYTTIQMTTPFGLSTIIIVCQKPEMFRELKTVLSNESMLWDWWCKWGKSPLLISCPVYLDKDEKRIFTYSIRSQPIIYEGASMESPQWLNRLLSEGNYTIASGQTMILGLHRTGSISKGTMLHLLESWISHYKEIHEDMALWNPYLQWYMNFDTLSLPFLMNIKTNTLVGDHLALYASYGRTHPEVMTFLFQHSTLNPVISYVHGNRIIYISLYSKWIRSPTNAWSTIDPFLSKMTVQNFINESDSDDENAENFIEDPLYLSPLTTEWFLPFARQFQEAPRNPDLPIKIKWIQREYNMSPTQIAFKLYLVTFQNRLFPKRVLEGYWEFIYQQLISSHPERWTYLIGYMLYHYYFRVNEMPWAFLKWVFKEPHRSRVQWFLKIHYRVPRSSSPQSLIDIFRTFSSRPETTVAKFYKKVLQPSLQERLRVVYQLRREWTNHHGHQEMADIFSVFLQKNKEALLA